MDGEYIKGFLGLGGLVIIAGLVQLIKSFIKDTRYFPLVAIGFGVALNFGAVWALNLSNRIEIFASIMSGIVVGLSASGLYSTIQTFKEGDAARKDNPFHDAKG